MKQRLVVNTLRRIHLYSGCTHIRTHISEPVQKNIYRQCTRGYIYIYIFHLDYLQEKGSPFLRKYKYSNFSIFCQALMWMQNYPALLSPSISSARRHVTKQNRSDMHIPPGPYTQTYTLYGQ